MTANIAGKVIKQLIKKLIISSVIITVCVLMMQVNMALGVILMMGYSSWMVVKSSSKEMPLGKITAILPGLMALLCFLFMLAFVGINNPLMPISGIAIGVIPGWLMARGHQIYEKNGVVYAKRTLFYVFIWALTMLFTQGSRLKGLPGSVAEFSFFLNGFSTAMMVVLSVFLFAKAQYNQKTAASAKNTVASFLIFALSTAIFSVAIHQPEAFAVGGSGDDRVRLVKAAQYVFKNEQAYMDGGQHARIQQSNVNNLIAGCEYEVSYSIGRLSDQGAAATFSLGLQSLNPSYAEDVPPDLINLLEKQMIEEYGPYHGTMYQRKKGHLTNGGRGAYFIFPAQREHFDDIFCMTWFWQYNDWFIKYNYVGIPSQPRNLANSNPTKYMEDMIFRIQQRIKSLDNNNVPQSPIRGFTPDPIDPTGTLEKIRQVLSGLKFSDEAAAAGVAAALVQLLAGLGMGAAMTTAQETANAIMTASQTAANTTAADQQASDNYSSSSIILEGPEAVKWMKDERNGYYKDGEPTKKFEDFLNSLPSQEGSGLQGFAGDTDGKIPTSDDYIIIVDGTTPKPEEEPEKVVEEDTTDGGGGGGGEGEEEEKKEEKVDEPAIDFDYLIHVKEEEIRLQEEEIRKKKQDLMVLGSDIKKIKEEIDIASEVEFTNSLINILDFALGTKADMSAPSWFLNSLKSLQKMHVRYKKTGKLPSYGELRESVQKYVKEKIKGKTKTPLELFGEMVDTQYSGAYSKSKEFLDYKKKQESRYNQLDRRRKRYPKDKDAIETLEIKLEDEKHQLDLLEIKRGDIP